MVLLLKGLKGQWNLLDLLLPSDAEDFEENNDNHKNSCQDRNEHSKREATFIVIE